MNKLWPALVTALFLCSALPVRADEGMWTFNAFPGAKVRATYGFAPSRAWLDHVQHASPRIEFGCSSSFVSAHGLVMTNHHCALDCLENLSKRKHDAVPAGFYAARSEDEPKCPGFEMNVLGSIRDVTTLMRAATKGKAGRALIDAQQAEQAQLESSCGKDEAVRCDVVSLYNGGLYHLYRYKRYTDVRLVFAPDYDIAQFGGDPDNFNFPRYDFDVSFVRAYENGSPAATPAYLHWSKSGAKAGDLTFVPGDPGDTQRLLTIAQLEYLRDVSYPHLLPEMSEYRGILEQYQKLGPEQLRQTKEDLFYLENDLKETRGMESALLDPSFFGTKVFEERRLRAAVAGNPALAKRYGADWNQLAAVQTHKAQLYLRYDRIERGPDSPLFQWARHLVRLPAERAKPQAQRLPEYADAQLVTLPQQLLASIPTYSGPQELAFAFYAKGLREDLGPDDPFVKAVLGFKSPDQWAHDLIAGTKLSDSAVRKALYDGGQPAIDASNDTLIRFVAATDSQARAVRKRWEDEVEAPERRLGEDLAHARFAVEGTSVYPDATFTPRLSYGTIKGFAAEGVAVPPFTYFAGLYNRATGSDPYALPQRWLDARAALDPQMPMNFVTDNDVVGGNSGSPVIDRNAEIVGLVFDGNIYSLGGAFGFDDRVNRTVAVDSRALLAGLKNVYHADRLVSEISP